MENLGKKAKDKVTGFIGIVSAKCYHLYGCAQYGLTPEIDKDGKMNNVGWFDEGRIEIIGKGINPNEVKVEINGCEGQPHP